MKSTKQNTSTKRWNSSTNIVAQPRLGSASAAPGQPLMSIASVLAEGIALSE